jgi:uncharacterized protein DUF5134
MVIESVAARWLLTVAFAAAALGAVLPRRGPAGSARRADRAKAVFCQVMCAALIAMAWRPEPAAAAWAQAAGFGCAAIVFIAGWRTRPSLDRLHHALMAGAMIWMLIAGPGAARPSPGHGHGAMAAMPGAGLPVPVLAVSGLVAACCAAASIPWLARAIGPGLRVRDPAAAGQAAMSAGMAAMLIAML